MGIHVTKLFLEREFENLKRDLEKASLPEVAAEYKKRLDKMHNQPLNIAVTGDAGAGKSSLVNAIRGVSDHDMEAAKVGVVEETMEPKEYPHPKFPNMKIWDLPGIGTPKFQAAEYLKQVNFERYDVFIIVYSERFTENNALLAKEIQKMNKKFYCVRTKIDHSIESEKRNPNFNMEETLETIRNYCEDRIRDTGGPPAKTFLISSWKVKEYDFPLLQETIATELPEHQKDVLTRAMHIFSEKELMMKKKLMKSYIEKVTLVSCYCGTVPVPGLPMVTDIAILQHTLRLLCRAFGFDDRSLHFLEVQTGKRFEELKSAITKTPLANEIDMCLVISRLTKSSLWVSLSALEVILDFIPVVGSLFDGASSPYLTYHFLNKFLNEAVEDAQNVLEMIGVPRERIQGNPKLPFE
ncbi:interferon-inducible GTPase 5-like [Thamnophis elegans]|uniref:interferon-inducible GTPase 5-like n=1 Tax=Thamnophis elegans TaxID=35005 RepID=UPI001377453A|nr:interferon-inducible GTPase 5-like [Thamnophis elegans]